MNIDLKQEISTVLQQFSKKKLFENCINLFNTLGYNTSRQSELADNSYDGFCEHFETAKEKINPNKKCKDHWQKIELLFQLTQNEMTNQSSIFGTGRVDNTIMFAYLFFAIELKDNVYTRTQLSDFTREINKVFEIPVMVVFIYGECITLSVIKRRLDKKDSAKDVLEKITLIKDIRISKPHRAHIEILFDLSYNELQREHKATSFVALHNAWQATLDTKILNKNFFNELSNWYFWAQRFVSFPNDKQLKEQENVQLNLIRLITRMIFVWFLKEKKLVPDNLFDKAMIQKWLKHFDADSATTKNYYTAILQNLFFATLNQKMNEREFAKDGGSIEANIAEYGIKTKYRYAKQFAITEAEVVELMKEVPFLNGGLFDCLDKENEEDKNQVVYIDGFSRNASKTPTIPDLLFFGKEHTEDLSEAYGYKRNKEKCRGLFEIFNDYKFTIEENTPLEEEIALDPELLGKVFENLLAFYNPETGTPARKQTGSFYTPREIVNYMVDESLIAYLKTKMMEAQPAFVQLGKQQTELWGNETRVGQLKMEIPVQQSAWKGKEDVLEENLRLLLSYNNDGNPFGQDQEIDQLIYAIDHCKILDPACGSGAFPMGILHKLVHVLGKLDKDNIRWRELQKQKAIVATKQAYDEGDVQQRNEKIEEISNTFDNNASDYGRKLYLIENCIYGVDIQPIAVQISKLRFFISLVVDQREKQGTPNRGIRPLPNLETKFVAANTLIGLEKPKQAMLMPIEYAELEQELTTIRHKHFEAKNRKEKTDSQRRDKAIRKQIAALLVNSGWATGMADKIAKFDIYDQNTSADWFEPEWMFGQELVKGFDVVIGNPPYVQMQKDGGKLANEYGKQNFDTFERMGDLYSLFYEKGVALLKQNSHLTFITSNKWMRAGYGESTRKFFIEKTNPIQLIDFGGVQVFDSATVDTNILVTQKAKYKGQLQACIVNKNEDSLSNLSDYFRQNKIISTNFSADNGWVILSSIEEKIKSKIEKIGTPLKDWDINIYRGILTGYNEAFIITKKVRDRLVEDDPKSDEIIRPILRGRDIEKYKANWAGLYLITTHTGYKDSNGKFIEPININKYPSVKEHLDKYWIEISKRQDKGITPYNLRSCIYMEDFFQHKIMYPNMTKYMPFIYDKEKYFSNDKSFIITGKNIAFLTAFFNSSIFKFCFRENFPELQGGTRELRKIFFDKIPVIKVTNDQNIIFENMVIEVQKMKNGKQDTLELEKEIDNILFDLYDLNKNERDIIGFITIN